MGNISIMFKDIVGYEGKYIICSDGKVWSCKNKKFLKPRYTKTGYARVHLGYNTDYYIHKLVAEAFIPNPHNYKCINHKDENKKNNNINNLEWCSVKYNNEYGTRIQNLKMNEPNKKEIIMCSKEDKIELKEFCSLREAARQMNLNEANISHSCHNEFKRSCGGYYWKFKNKEGVE